MQRKQSTAYSGRGRQPKPSRVPTVAELAKRMSELLRLRREVERAERGLSATASRLQERVSRARLLK